MHYTRTHNRYDILYRLPATSHANMSAGLEALAQEIVRSGRLRINTGDSKNFAYYSASHFEKTVSYREMTDPNLLPETQAMIARSLPGGATRIDKAEAYQQLLREFRTAKNITLETEMACARLLVQCTHPVNIQLCLIQKVDVFVSFSHTVGDLMPVHSWDAYGDSSGLQSLGLDSTEIRVSCGGNPFSSGDAPHGFAALARGMVIGAQECAHFADLKRDAVGQVIGRHSATMQPLRASQAYAHARHQDIACVQSWHDIAKHLGLDTLIRQEKAAQFYRKQRKYAPKSVWQQRKLTKAMKAFLHGARQSDYHLISEFPHKLHGSQGFAQDLQDCLADMAFNLSPFADAYRRDDPDEEEAIAVIEALARVPQQAVKWGHRVTQLCWPNLYQLYYDEVIPANIATYENLSGKKWLKPEMKRPKGKP